MLGSTLDAAQRRQHGPRLAAIANTPAMASIGRGGVESHTRNVAHMWDTDGTHFEHDGLSSLTDDELLGAFFRCSAIVKERRHARNGLQIDETCDYMFALFEELRRRARTTQLSPTTRSAPLAGQAGSFPAIALAHEVS